MSPFVDRFAARGAGLAILLCLASCSVQPPPGLVPADGVFRWDSGEPLAGIQGIARFHPYDPANPKIETSARSGDEVVSARVEEDGSFVVLTSRMVQGKARDFPGVVPGQYKILLHLIPGDGGVPRINPDYEHPVRSPLLIEVFADRPNHLQVAVERSFNGWQP